jgi:hypothetical protein
VMWLKTTSAQGHLLFPHGLWSESYDGCSL